MKDIESKFYSEKFDEILENFAARALGNSTYIEKVSDLKKDIEKAKPLFNQFKDSKFKSLFRKFNDKPTLTGKSDPNAVSQGIREQQPDRDNSEIFDMVALFNDIWSLNKLLPEKDEKEELKEAKDYEEEYLAEAVGQDKRVGVKHLYAPGNPQQVGPDGFVDLVGDIVKNGGKIDSKNSKITEKADGQSLKFGLDEGVPFVETSYSGLIYDFKDYEKSFKEKVQKKGGDMEGASNYIAKSNAAFDYFLKDKKLIGFLKELGSNIKVFGELFNRALAQKSNGKLQFVGIAYDEKHFGDLGAFAIHEIAIEGVKLTHEKKRVLKAKFAKLSDSRMTWLDDEMPDISVNLTNWTRGAKAWIKNRYPLTKNRSRDEISRKEKEEALKEMEFLLGELNESVKKRMPDGGKWGDSREGVILKLPSGIYKITSQAYKDFKKKQKEEKLNETLEIAKPRGILRPFMSI